MKALGRNPTSEEIQQIIKEFDDDHDGQISFEEFLNLMRRPGLGEAVTGHPSPEGRSHEDVELLHAFSVFDKDGSGKINFEELSAVMKSIGRLCSYLWCYVKDVLKNFNLS